MDGDERMSYITDNLKPNEEILFETRLHWAFLVLTALWSWILIFIPLIIAILKYISTEFVVTNQRIVIKHGILSKNVDEASLDKIQNISLRQGFIGRLVGFGTIIVQTAATFGRDTFPYVNNPIEMQKVVSNQVDIYKESQFQKHAELIAKSMKESS